MAYFNADERARELNQGSGHKISPEIRAIVNQELESFILGHIHDRLSFAYETTLRTTITYEQARLAKGHGFQTSMEYVTLASVEESINRVRKRAERGGHSAPPERVREIYEASLKNLPRALTEFDYVAVFDNTDIENRQQPALILQTVNGVLNWRISRQTGERKHPLAKSAESDASSQECNPPQGKILRSYPLTVCFWAVRWPFASGVRFLDPKTSTSRHAEWEASVGHLEKERTAGQNGKTMVQVKNFLLTGSST